MRAYQTLAGVVAGAVAVTVALCCAYAAGAGAAPARPAISRNYTVVETVSGSLAYIDKCHILRTQTIGSHHEYLFGGCLRQTVTGAPAGTLTAASASSGPCPRGFVKQLESQLIAMQWLFASHLPKHRGWLPHVPLRSDRAWERRLYDDVNEGLAILPVCSIIGDGAS